MTPIVNMILTEKCFIASIFELGAVAQLGERLNGIQEVVGSIPISSTSNIKHLEGCF